MQLSNLVDAECEILKSEASPLRTKCEKTVLPLKISEICGKFKNQLSPPRMIHCLMGYHMKKKKACYVITSSEHIRNSLRNWPPRSVWAPYWILAEERLRKSEKVRRVAKSPPLPSPPLRRDSMKPQATQANLPCAHQYIALAKI